MTRSVEICRQERTLLSQELNNQLTRVDKGQPAGEVLRRYWQPAALAEELDTERPVVPVTLFGEKLVLFRDGHGVLGLLDHACPHRGVDLCYGRLENDGLRCPFHGWKFAADGQCMEQPGEPEGSEFYKRLTTTAYPVVEKNGKVVHSYARPGEYFGGLSTFAHTATSGLWARRNATRRWHPTVMHHCLWVTSWYPAA